MKPVISLALIVSLVGSTVPVAAQDSIEPASGPLARAVAREATRLAREPFAVAAVPQTNATPDSNWSRVRRLRPGTEIVVTIRGQAPATRYVALGDQSGVDLLNVATLPADSARALLEVARGYPLFVADARRAGVRAGNVRLEPAGVFIDGQKVAELGQVLERAERADVAEVRIDRLQAWSTSKKASVGVGAGMASLGAILLALGFHRSNEAQEAYEKCLPIAGYHCSPGVEGRTEKTVGIFVLAIGAVVMAANAAHKEQGTVYRAP